MPDSAQMIIANRLRDGLTVFRAPDGSWVEAIAAGAIARTSEDAQAMLSAAEADAQRNLVVGPYLIDVTQESGTPQPLSWRETIRANGPTVETGRSTG
jgi:hypothetical protein